MVPRQFITMCTKAGGLSAAGASPVPCRRGMHAAQGTTRSPQEQTTGWMDMDLTARTTTGKQAHHEFLLPLLPPRASSYTLFWHMLATCARFFDGENSLGLNWN